MNSKCNKCRLVNYPGVTICVRCRTVLGRSVETERKKRGWFRALVTRVTVCAIVCVAVVLGFYLSLIASAGSLTIDEKSTVRAAINELRAKGFDNEVFMLDHFTIFRSTDNWLNASVPKENAYAATNFPFEIITLYTDFFTYPVDKTEQAAILLHEARHLLGDNEEEAYRYVWRHRRQLGWTQEKYFGSPVWSNVRRQTREAVPELFTCDKDPRNDCDE